MSKYLLGYDIGSSSVKASLVNADTGKCVSSAFFPKTEEHKSMFFRYPDIKKTLRKTLRK